MPQGASSLLKQSSMQRQKSFDRQPSLQRSHSAKSSDPLALDDEEPLDGDDGPKAAQWEHEDLAQVRVKVFRGHTEGVLSVQFFKNDTKIISGSKDQTVRIWDKDVGTEDRVYTGHSGFVSAVTMCPQSNETQFVTSGWDKSVRKWDLETGQVLWKGHHEGLILKHDQSSDGRFVVTVSDLDHAVKVWDSRTGECIHHIEDLHERSITSCRWSPSNDKFATTSMDHTCRFWDMVSCQNTITLTSHGNTVSDCDITEDQRRFVTCSWDKTIAIWDISTGMYRSEGPVILERAHDGCVSSVAFNTNGNLLISGAYDCNISMWDVDNAVKKICLKGHIDWVHDSKLSSDVEWALSCSEDKTVRLWYVAGGDSIPMAFENRRNLGVEVINCQECGKPFSIAHADDPSQLSMCVFCRLQHSSRVSSRSKDMSR